LNFFSCPGDDKKQFRYMQALKSAGNVTSHITKRGSYYSLGVWRMKPNKNHCANKRGNREINRHKVHGASAANLWDVIDRFFVLVLFTTPAPNFLSIWLTY
jgi:hypothetical protein